MGRLRELHNILKINQATRLPLYFYCDTNTEKKMVPQHHLFFTYYESPKIAFAASCPEIRPNTTAALYAPVVAVTSPAA